MKRTQIQLDERTYQALRRAAHDQGRSMSAVARDAIARDLNVTLVKRRLTLEDFTSIGAGASDDGDLAPVSVRHDEALAEIYYEDIRLGQEGYRKLLEREAAAKGSASTGATADKSADK